MTDKEAIEKKLIQIFGEEQVDLKDTGGAIIHFPEIEIENSQENTHTIKDLYIKLNWNYSSVKGEEETVNNFINSLSGIRATFTDEEFFSGYIHSHLPPIPNPEEVGDSENEDFDPNYYNLEWVDFCLGSDNVYQTLSDLNMGFKIDKFQILLNLLDDFVRWESLDGGPHIEMKDIVKKNDSYRQTTAMDDIDFNTAIAEHFVYKTLAIEEIASFDFHIEEKELHFLKPDKILEILEVVLYPTMGLFGAKAAYKHKGIYYIKSSGGLVDLSDRLAETTVDGGFLFKDKTIYPQIVKTIIEDKFVKLLNEEAVKVIHPAIPYHVMLILQYDLYKYLNKTHQWKLVKS